MSPAPVCRSINSINNVNGTFATPNTLDFTLAVANQQTRVDVITTSADPFSVMPADVLLALLAPNANTAGTRRLP